MASRREHPAQPADVSQGCLRILYDLQKCLLAITGMDAATLQPVAGAQGELTGLLMIRAYLAKPGQRAQKSSDPRFGARHESRFGGDRGLRSSEHQVQRRAARSIPTICANSPPKMSPR